MSRRFVRGLLLFVLVLGIATTVLLWDSEDTTAEASGCIECVSYVDCNNVFPGTVCNAGQGCICRIHPTCGGICVPGP